jgi:hypothetical protein
MFTILQQQDIASARNYLHYIGYSEDELADDEDVWDLFESEYEAECA